MRIPDGRSTALMMVLAWSAAGCAQHYTSTGLILRTDKPSSTITISHDAFPGFMDAMVMPFDVRGAARRVELAPGHRVRIRLAVKRGRSWIDRVEVISAPLVDAGLQQTPRAPFLVPVGSPVPDFELTDQASRPVVLSTLKGKVVAVTFIYTRCPLPDYCPRMIANFRAVRDRFAARMDRDLVLLTISFDPQTRYARDPGEIRRCRTRGRPGMAFPDRRSHQCRTGLQRLRHPVLAGGRAHHAFAAVCDHRSRGAPRCNHRRKGFHTATARRSRGSDSRKHPAASVPSTLKRQRQAPCRVSSLTAPRRFRPHGRWQRASAGRTSKQHQRYVGRSAAA